MLIEKQLGLCHELEPGVADERMPFAVVGDDGCIHTRIDERSVHFARPLRRSAAGFLTVFRPKMEPVPGC